MKYYEDDRPRPIPEEYLKMTPEELDREIERVYQKYYGNRSNTEIRPKKNTSPVKFYF